MRALLLASLAWLTLAPAALAPAVAGAQPYETASIPAGRLRLSRPISAAPPPDPSPTTQTAYFGPKTLVGHGGARPDGIVLPATAPETASYYWEPTYQWAVPKNGVTKTYSSVRASPLSGCEIMTVTDAAAVVFTYNLCADQAIAGDYTWRWRPGDTQSSTTGTNQLFKAFSASAYGDHLVMRRGTTLNTTADTGGYSGTAAFRFGCSVGTCNYANFTGSNHRVIRPELGQTNTVGPIWFENSGVGGTHFIGFSIDGENESYNASNYMLKDATLVPGMIFENLTIVGSSSDPYGKDRPGGIQVDNGGTPDILNSSISYVQNGIIITMGLGTSADIFAGSTAPVQELTRIVGVEMREIGRDNLTVQCPRYLYVANNIFTDQVTEINPGTSGTSPPYTNPFDSARQPHSDKVQLNFQNTPTNACAYNYYPGVTFLDNFFGRGNGRDTQPDWTSPPVPNPNDYAGGTLGSNAGIPTEGRIVTPAATYALGDSQGIFPSNFAAGTKSNGGVTRNYMATFDAPIFKGNIITTVFNAGLSVGSIRDGEISGNIVLGPRVAGSNNLETWSGFGNAGILIYGLEGSPVIARNVANTQTCLLLNTAGTVCLDEPTAGEVVEVPIAQYPTVFQNPNGKLSPRTPAEYRQYYRPVPGQVLDLGGGVVAGAACFDGSAPGVGGVCP